MLIYVIRSGKMRLKSYFGKRLLRKCSGNKYLFYLFYFNTIVRYFPKVHKLALKLEMPFSRNDAISDFTFFRVFRVIYRELNTLHSCVMYNFKDNFV